MTKDAVRRALRTFIQSWSGIFLGLWVTSGVGVEKLADVGDLTVIAKLAFSAAISTIPAMVSLLQNTYEDKTGRALLVKKANPDPEPTQPPIGGAVVPDVLEPAAADEAVFLPAWQHPEGSEASHHNAGGHLWPVEEGELDLVRQERHTKAELQRKTISQLGEMLDALDVRRPPSNARKVEWVRAVQRAERKASGD